MQPEGNALADQKAWLCLLFLASTPSHHWGSKPLARRAKGDGVLPDAPASHQER